MTDKEKLVTILKNMNVIGTPTLGFTEYLADYLISNGVTFRKRGFWNTFVRSALVNWKDGEPVWADRNVYRCDNCDWGTIVKTPYCPRCGVKMDLEV